MFSKFRFLFLLIPASLLFSSAKNTVTPFSAFVTEFASGYEKLNLPEMAYDYREYFNSIPSPEEINRQEMFFKSEADKLKLYDPEKLKEAERVTYDHLNYEIAFNLQRTRLEKLWVNDGRIVPVGGLHSLKNYGDWYSYFIKKFTSLELSPEEVMALGKREVKRVQEEIKQIQVQSGLDSLAFYTYIKSDAFYITDKEELNKLFHKIDSTIRKGLPAFIGEVKIPEVFPMEWPGAGAGTPPGIYMNRADNPYGKDVFQYNFFNGRYNRRAIEWLYMHEAIPGHHLQSSLRTVKDPLQEQFLYPGNFEGWGCYVEYEGKALGVYKDSYSYLGKWEWDLVRSARLVIETGIHYYGWSREEALDYWKKNLPTQEEIAEREITRVTNWAGQALSYKTGADCIMQLRQMMQEKHKDTFDLKKFHRCYLAFGMRPLEVIKKDFEQMYALKNFDSLKN